MEKQAKQGRRTRIKIRLKSGKWLTAPAYPTSHPKLFVTPERERSIRADLKPSQRGRFLDDTWTVTHGPSGYSIVFGTYSLDEAQRLAELFARSAIPWEQLRSKRQAKKYARQHKAAMKRFYEEYRRAR